MNPHLIQMFRNFQKGCTAAIWLFLLPVFCTRTDAAPHARQTGAAGSLAIAEKALLQGQADAASSLLQSLIVSDPSGGRAHLLLCRVWLSEEMWAQAVTECQAALATGLKGNSAAEDWTGRAMGHQAEHAGPLAGLKLALQVRNAFETAVDLDGSNEAACVDLGEYYVAAPMIVGGGLGKARALADRVQATLPAVAHRIRAMAALKDKDLAAAENEFRAEIAASRKPGTLVDLAAFYDSHGRGADAIATARQVIEMDRAMDATVLDAASILDDQHQTALAEDTLRRYIAHGEHTDAGPVFRVHTRLGDMRTRAGDKMGAREQYQAALALASGYAPARKALGTL